MDSKNLIIDLGRDLDDLINSFNDDKKLEKCIFCNFIDINNFYNYKNYCCFKCEINKLCFRCYNNIYKKDDFIII